MSHTLAKVNAGNNAFSVVKIVDYVSGGEHFTLAEMGLTSLADVRFLVPDDSNIKPRYLGAGIVALYGDAGNSIPDLPSTVGLNFVFIAIALG